MIEALISLGTLIPMALFVWLALRYFRRIRDGRADPIISPSWTDDMRPASPHSVAPEDPPEKPRF